MSFIIHRPRKESARIIKKGRPSDIKIGILIPIPYNAAINSLFFQTAYEYINSLEGVIAYRYVYDIKNDVVEALDAAVSPSTLDAILISIAFELDYITVARILDKLNLLHKYKGYRKPILISGGVAVTANPLPLTNIIDVVVIGEVDELLKDLVYAVGDNKPLNRLESFNCISTLPLKDRVEKCFVRDLNHALHAVNQFYALDEEPVYGHGVRVEVSRGCPYLCAFCMEGHIQYPFRYRGMETLLKIVEKGLENSMAKRVILYSLSLFNVPFMDSFLEKLKDNSIEVSFPSLRVNHITKKRLEVVRELGQKTLTIAPETLIKGIACAIGKCYDVEHLENIIEEAFYKKFEHVKLYLITGFPKTDLREELEAFKKLLSKFTWIKRTGFLRVVLNPLIPKPWTPYQFLPPSTVLNLSDNISGYYKVAKEFGFIRIEKLDCRWAFAQAVLAQGDDRLSDMVIQWGRYGLSLSGFYKALRLLSEEVKDFIYNGWREPPWYRAIDMGLPYTYFRMRYSYLAN